MPITSLRVTLIKKRSSGAFIRTRSLRSTGHSYLKPKNINIKWKMPLKKQHMTPAFYNEFKKSESAPETSRYFIIFVQITKR